jgi:2-oxoglutarate ferredoxin oxidoreductase subunit delta
MPEMVVPGSASLTTAEAAPKRRGPRGKVTIYPNWCKGCHICVEFCPTGVLAFIASQEYPHVVYPDKCTGCHWCDTHCPDLAIVVQPIE